MAFDEPGQVGEYLKPADILGHLLLVWTVGYIPHSPTQFTRPDKQSDVIVVDCVDLDVNGGTLVRTCWWRNAKLIGALRSKIGRPDPMLAVMTLGIATKGNPPFELISATRDEESVDRANTWLAANPDFVPSVWESREMPAATAAATETKVEPVVVRKPNETMLERMARISQENKLPPRAPQTDEPPF